MFCLGAIFMIFFSSILMLNTSYSVLQSVSTYFVQDNDLEQVLPIFLLFFGFRICKYSSTVANGRKSLHARAFIMTSKRKKKKS
jgi:hypothetical protein